MKKKTAARAAIATSVLAVATLLGAPAAQASPSGCATGWGSNGSAYGNCSSGTGQYRIGIPCKTVFTAFTQYSSWHGVNSAASVSCPFGSWLWTDIPGGPHIVLERRN